MDFVSLPLVTDSHRTKYDTFFVIEDPMNGYIQAIPCLKSGLDAEEAARLFIRHSIAITGLPLEILSDNDHLITSKFFQTIMDILGIEQHSAIIYRPKGNGRAERAVRSVINILRLTLAGLRDNGTKLWIEVLPWATFLQNSLPGVVSGYSPNRIVFGRELVYPGELPMQVVE